MRRIEARERSREVRVDRLLGRRVLDRSGRSIGRLEEIRVELRDARLVVSAYVIGAAGLLERLGVGVRLLLGLQVRGRVVRQDQMDLSGEHPRLTCGVDELA